MPKVIALQSRIEPLAQLLRDRGYKVIDMYQAHHQRAQVDAYLYTNYHPDSFMDYNGLHAAADISLGSNTDFQEHPTTFMLNITDLPAEQILSTLEHRLRPNRWHT